jgi:hypothetical protein
VLEAIIGVFSLIGDGVAWVLEGLGFERFIERDEAKPDARNFKPPH